MFPAPRTKRVPAFSIRVIYKSGAEMEFNVLSFKFKNGATGTTYEWELAPDSHVKPIQFGADDVAAVWQLRHYSIEVPEDPNEGAQP
jgi:hypothetical protein